MPVCKWCQTSIRKMTGDEKKPDNLASWIHMTGYYQCPGSRSEYDLATYDPRGAESQADGWASGAGI